MMQQAINIEEMKYFLRSLFGNSFDKPVQSFYTCSSEGSQCTLVTQTKIYMLLASWEVRIVKNCDRGLENAARGLLLQAAFSSPRSQFFTMHTDPKPNDKIFIFFLSCKLAGTCVC